MSTRPTPPPNGEPSSETLTRLYALWMIGALLLVLLVVVLALLGTGRLRLHAQRISEQTDAIEQLREDLSRTRRELAELKAGPPARPQTAQEPSPPTTPEAAGELPDTDQTPPTATDQAIAGRLDAALQTDEQMGYELADPEVADQVLQEGLSEVGDATWSGRTWARLAVVARLLDRDGPADTFAHKAIATGEFPRDYYELSVQRMLAQGRATEAIVFAGRLRAERPDNPRAALLLAEAYCLQPDLAAADAVVETLDRGQDLSPSLKLRLGRLLVALERWNRLEALLNSFGEVRPEDLSQLNFLRAVLAIQRNRLAEALAIFDNLLAEHPEDYDIRTWRGVALLAARQFQAARQALAHSRAFPGRPEAWYWRGMLELRAGNDDEAVTFFEHALAASQRYAPAWEALGTIALNRGDLPTAVQNLQNAVAANPRRASTHFLLSIVHAKTLQPTATADALRTALRLDPSLLEQAQQTEVIGRLFTPEELEALAHPVDDLVAPLDEAEPE
jgi:tetratricopeptide (TPR) repeat protein